MQLVNHGLLFFFNWETEEWAGGWLCKWGVSARLKDQSVGVKKKHFTMIKKQKQKNIAGF